MGDFRRILPYKNTDSDETMIKLNGRQYFNTNWVEKQIVQCIFGVQKSRRLIGLNFAADAKTFPGLAALVTAIFLGTQFQCYGPSFGKEDKTPSMYGVARI